MVTPRSIRSLDDLERTVQAIATEFKLVGWVEQRETHHPCVST
jgi:hypothetical protein